MGGNGNNDGLDLFPNRMVLCTDERVAVGTILLRPLDHVVLGENAPSAMKYSKLTSRLAD
jgi:hypothetical protein